MKILWLAPHNIHLEPVITGLATFRQHEIEIHWYDRSGLPSDIAILNRFDRVQPDLMIYTGSNGGPSVPSTGTFLRIRRKVPTVFICHDGSDTTWKPLLREYREKQAFTVTVNIDGNDDWEKGPNDFTALTPTNPEFYRNQIPLLERPIKFAFAGGYASPSRREIVEYLAKHAGLIIPPRNETYGSYQRYADFMCQTQIVLNVPWSGSDNASQVKGRVLESGWAGCVLLDHESSASKRWFCPGMDFYTYRSKENAVEVVKELLENPERLTITANDLQRIVKTHHSPSAFWKNVFQRAFS